ncbi:hypothetical protein yc1106_06448 [Curvularia clavata]|uniref:Uncharacterized protein n=1 Tax=Curvularia clavata TaxID=95742 RepID=A0A9Q8ZCY9_CURCL|nr:hypothetical protein yc1106_06448 [Curvularia clavata]
METGQPSKAKHQGAGTIPPKAAPLPHHGTIPTPTDTSRIPRRVQSHRSLPDSPAGKLSNPHSAPNANRTLVDANSGSLEGKNWPLIPPKIIAEHQTLEQSSLPGLSHVDPITGSSSHEAIDDNNVHVRRLCHSSSSAASTDTAPVLRIAADADAVILGSAGDIPPVPSIPSYIPKGATVPSYIPEGHTIQSYIPKGPSIPSRVSKGPTIPSKIPKVTSMPSKIPKGLTRQSSSGTFRDRILEPLTSSSVTPPAQETWPTGSITEMDSGPKINPIRSMKPSRKLGPDGSSPMSPLPLAQTSIIPSTTHQVSPAFSDTEVASRDLDEPTKHAASTSQVKRSVGQCISAWSSSSSSPQTTHSHNIVRNQDLNMVRETETATFNIVDSSLGREPPQRRQSDDSDEQLDEHLHEHSDEELQQYSEGQSDDSNEQSDGSDDESDEQLPAPSAAPFPLKHMPPKDQSTLQNVKAKRSIRKIFSRSRSRVNLVGEAPASLPSKHSFLSAFRSKSHVNLTEETRPTKYGFFSMIRSKSRVNLGETAPATEQSIINASSNSLAEVMPNSNGHTMPSTPPDIASHSDSPARPFTSPEVPSHAISPVRKPAPKDSETRRTELLEMIARLSQKPNNPARDEIHLRIAKVSKASHTLLPTECLLTTITKQELKEVVKSSNNAELAESNAIKKSVQAAGDAKQAQDWAKLAGEHATKAKQYAEQADHYAGRAETWAKNAHLMAREASISRAKAEKHSEDAQKHLKELWELLEAAGLEGDERLTIEELARELVNYRNPWTE